jgi:hypothetical protein
MELKRFDEPVVFDYPKIPGVRFKIRSITDKVILDIRAKSKIGKLAVELPYPDPNNPGRNEIQIVDNYDDSKFEWETFKYALQGWEGIKLNPDQNLTNEQMIEAIFNNRKMRRFIVDKAMVTYRIENEILEEELKNLRDIAGWIIDNQDSISCSDCKKVYQDLSKSPPCEECRRDRPSIHPANMDAWRVYQMAAIDAMGISAQGIIEVSRLLKVPDAEECFIKVSELVREIRKLSEPVSIDRKSTRLNSSHTT